MKIVKLLSFSGSIEDSGYIRRTIQDVVDDMAFTQGIYTDEKTVERVLTVVQQPEPSGVGARDLQECLLIQLKHKTLRIQKSLAIDIIDKQFDAFTKSIMINCCKNLMFLKNN